MSEINNFLTKCRTLNEKIRNIVDSEDPKVIAAVLINTLIILIHSQEEPEVTFKGLVIAFKKSHDDFKESLKNQ